MSDDKPETKTPAKAAKSPALGDIVAVTEGDEVIRPDGSHHVINGTEYVLDVPGTHKVAGTEVTVS